MFNPWGGAGFSTHLKHTKMKRYFIMMLVLAFSMSMAAEENQTKEQKRAAHEKQLTEQTNAYIQSFGLSGEQAEHFRNIYLDYNKKLHGVKLLYKKEKPNDTLTEEEIEAAIRTRFARQKEILNIRETYFHKLRTVLKPSQIQKIYDDERARKERLQHKRPAK